MLYEYSGYLNTILDSPNPTECDALPHVVFTADDLMRWRTVDFPSSREWQGIPVHRSKTGDGIRLVGRFEDQRKMDALSGDDPRFWVSLGTLELKDDRLPIDVARYPIAEITYRCTSDNAHPMWLWTYPGGVHLDTLPRTRQWRRLARRIPHFGFPTQVDTLVLRLYSTSRSTESIEVMSIRFREMSETEREACERDRLRLEPLERPRRLPALDDFLPLGVVMDAESVRRNMELLGLSAKEYWGLALEDIVTHHHNSIYLENISRLSALEWREILSFAEAHGVRVSATFDFDLVEGENNIRELIATQVKPYAESQAVLSWGLRREPPEIDFQHMLKAKAWIEEADPNHPVHVLTRHPSTYPLYAKYFTVAGMNHFVSHNPWDIRDIVETHLPLANGQQFWIVGPTFTYATGSPEWNTCPELRLMMNLAFASGARGWFSHAYHNDPIWIRGSYQRTLTGPFLMFSDLWLELDQRMKQLSALAPLLLQASPAPLPEEWHVAGVKSEVLALLPEGESPTSSYRLRGPDFNLFWVVSNDVRGLSSLNINIPPETLRGLAVFDLSEFVQNRTWNPMNLNRHVEMFPGQGQIVIVAPPEVCQRWRDVLARRLIEDDRRQLWFNLSVVRQYHMDTTAVDRIIEEVGNGDPMRDLERMDEARDMLIDLRYSSDVLRDLRTNLISATAGICACDGVLCRMMSRGKVDLAREWGQKVVPIAREITQLRLALRAGLAAEVSGQGEEILRKTTQLLNDMREIT